MLTVDFARLRLRPGMRVLDLGCGEGRHAFEVYRRGARVVALDRDAAEVATVRGMFAAMAAGRRGAAPAPARSALRGDALPAAVPGRRVRPGDHLRGARAHPGRPRRRSPSWRGCSSPAAVAVTVPRWWPERVCWALSDAYHADEGGHVRIYRAAATARPAARRRAGAARQPPRPRAALAVLVAEVRVRGGQRPARCRPAYHRLLVWDIMRRPWLTRCGRARCSTRCVGKSLVVYLRKPAAGEPG